MIIKAFSDDFFKELLKIRKKKILFFNGCFDILHLGHIKMINYIRTYMPEYHIICGINSDDSILLQDKQHPPINNAYNRAETIEELGIRTVIIFDEKTPKQLLMYLMPDIVFKGEEYRDKDYDEKEFLDTIRCDIKYFRNINGYSTTNIYNKISEQIKEDIRRSI